MSNKVSNDEEKKIIDDINSNDSKESKPEVKDVKTDDDTDDGIDWDTNTEEDADSDW